MSHEQNKKTLRHFQCRDYLWEVFEQMSSEIECSVDYLINESMRQYARSRNYGAKSTSGAAAAAQPASQPKPAPAVVAPPAVDARKAVGTTTASGARPSPLAQSIAPSTSATKPKVSDFGKTGAYPAAPAARSYGTSKSQAYPSGNQGAASNRPPATAPSAPPPLPRSSAVPPPAAASGAQPPLYVEFNGERYTVTKDEFVIGRSSKTADLAIKDGNVSRRHAAIVFRGGRYYIQDLGSTNGVEYNGARVESKAIDEGDIVQICDYELKFSYR